MTIYCTFLPQAWQNDYAVEVDAEGETQWTITLSELTELSGLTDPADLDEDSYARDELRFATGAPQWVKDWTGPFEVYWEFKP